MIRLSVALFIALCHVQFISAQDMCEGKSDGNYLCPYGDTPVVCGCHGGTDCPEGQLFDPTVSGCSNTREFFTRVVNCLQDASILAYAPIVTSSNYCEDHADGNYLCTVYGDSVSICPCKDKNPCTVGQFFDFATTSCIDPTDELVIKINTCLTGAETTPLPETTPETIPVETTPGSYDTQEPVPTCPSGYNVQVGNSCYKVIAEGKTWTDGGKRCKRDDYRSHLANIDTAEQNDALVAEMLKFKGRSQCFVYGAAKEIFYTSGQRICLNDCNNNTFVYRVSETNTLSFPEYYQNWKEGEPNCFNGRKENCMAYMCEDVEYVHQCGWADYECTRTGCLLCQIDL